MQHNFTGFVLVLVPERLPIEESARAAGTLRDSNVNVCGIIVNRILPENLNGSFYEARRKQEQIYSEEIRRPACVPRQKHKQLVPPRSHTEPRVNEDGNETAGTHLFRSSTAHARGRLLRLQRLFAAFHQTVGL